MRVWISAGEVSGDRLGASLARELRRLAPEAELAGIAGPRMREAGVEARGDALMFAHAGWTSVVGNLPRLLASARSAQRAMVDFGPDLFVAIDAPGLHRFQVRAARARGIRVAWLAPPQLWAWKARRIPELEDMPVYPLHAFELDSLTRAGARPRWYGYPGSRPGYPAHPEGRLLSLLPGTRPAWRRRHERLFREAADLARLDLDVVVAVPEGVPPGPGEMEVGSALANSALAMAMPGTGVLEAAWMRIPTLVAAHPGKLDLWWGGRKLVDGPLSLPNRILGEEILPELLRRPDRMELGRALGELWTRRETVSSKLAQMDRAMGDSQAMGQIARNLLETASG